MSSNKRLTIISGAFGTGKTEIAINLALKLKEEGIKKVFLVDLDIVNVYFRSRQKAYELEKLGIRVISSQKGLENADLPALSPEILRAFHSDAVDKNCHSERSEESPENYVKEILHFVQDDKQFDQGSNDIDKIVIDLGGSDLGGVVLSRFHEAIKDQPYDHWLVVNPYRPFNLKNEDTLEMAKKIEERSRLPITGMIANPHLLDETTLEVIKKGYEQVQKIEKYPLLLLSVMEKFYTADFKQHFDCPILVMKKEMNQPWEVGGIRIENR